MTRFPLLSSPRSNHITVHILGPDDLKTATPEVQHVAQRTGFNAKPGSIGISDKDDVSILLAGRPDQDSVFQWSAIVEDIAHSFGADALNDISFGLEFHNKGYFTTLNAVIGWGLGLFQHITYKTTDDAYTPPALLVEDADMRHQAEAILNGIALTRDLIHIPANSLGPEDLAGAAEDMAKLYKAKIKVIHDKDLLKENFPMVYAVGDSSHRRPCLIDIHWGRKDAPKLTLVGKGITFDTGGLNIKPAEAMKRMKKDMGGAAHVLGLAAMIMALELDVNLRVIIPAADNAVSSHAFRQQDVFTARNGKTIEIGHTDAEGRLVLSDALVAACEDKPDLLIDFATLTGAARVALGYDIPAIFASNPATGMALQTLSMGTDDPLWMMPLWQGYRHEMDSHIADINSIGSGRAGAIYGALFLSEFVSEGTDWVHMDVYGWSNTHRPGRARGGCDYGLRSCITYIQQWAQQQG